MPQAQSFSRRYELAKLKAQAAYVNTLISFLENEDPSADEIHHASEDIQRSVQSQHSTDWTPPFMKEHLDFQANHQESNTLTPNQRPISRVVLNEERSYAQD